MTVSSIARPPTACLRASRRPRGPRWPLLLLPALVLLGTAGAAEAKDPPRFLEPVPPMIAFPRPKDDSKPHPDSLFLHIDKEMGRSFASLGNIVRARRLFVRRFGLLCAPALVDTLVNKRDAYRWNAALTVAALRDTYGAAPELYPTLAPLARIMTETNEDFHTAAFAALALGCFHWAEARVPERYAKFKGLPAVPGPMRTRLRACRVLDETRSSILRRSNEPQEFVRIACLLALAKCGGPDARAGVLSRRERADAHVGEQEALLLSHALLEDEDAKIYLKALGNQYARIRAAAALGVAVALLTETPVAWTKDTAPILKALGGYQIKSGEDGAEAVFARGMLALRHEASGRHWDELWKLALRPTTEDTHATAAAQCLLFCDLPWFQDEAIARAGGTGVTLKDSVLALCLMRAGTAGTEKGIEACERWLRRGDKSPAPDDRWDPRWYAAVGLMRALHAGSIKSRELRVRAVDMLRRAADRVLDKKAAFRDVLAAILDQHAHKLSAEKLYPLPLDALRGLEAACRCPYALLSREPVEACVHRVNARVFLMFGLDGIKVGQPGQPNTEKQPERYLKRYLEDFPYFSRLDFLDERGVRPEPGYDGSDPLAVDR
jgi:hypothetical protein